MGLICACLAMSIAGLSDVALKASPLREPIRVNWYRTLGCLFPATLLLIFGSRPLLVVDIKKFVTLSAASGISMAIAVHCAVLALSKVELGVAMPLIRMAFLVTFLLEWIVHPELISLNALLGLALAALGTALLFTKARP